MEHLEPGVPPDIGIDRSVLRGLGTTEPPTVDLDPQKYPTISVEQTATVLGISRSSAFKAASSGEIPTVRFGRRVRVPTASLRKMLGLDGEPDAAA